MCSPFSGKPQPSSWVEVSYFTECWFGYELLFSNLRLWNLDKIILFQTLLQYTLKTCQLHSVQLKSWKKKVRKVDYMVYGPGPYVSSRKISHCPKDSTGDRVMKLDGHQTIHCSLLKEHLCPRHNQCLSPHSTFRVKHRSSFFHNSHPTLSWNLLCAVSSKYYLAHSMRN